MDNPQKMSLSHLMAGGPPIPPAPCPGMLVSVVLLRSDGVRVAPEVRKKTSPIIGRLVLDEFPRSRNKALIYRTQAQLFSMAGSSVLYSLHKPLFDPEIVHWDSRGIVIRGYEINSKDGQAIEYAQVWMITPVAQ